MSDAKTKKLMNAVNIALQNYKSSNNCNKYSKTK